MPADEITKAYTVSREILGIRALWAEVESLDNKVPALLQATMLLECGRLIERLTVWFLREAAQPLKIETLIGDYGQGVATLIGKLPDLLSAADLEMLQQRAEHYMGQGAPKAVADRVASLGLLAPACDIVRIARGAGMPVERVAGTYFTVGERFGFDWLRRAAGQLSTDTAWDKLAVTAIVDDFYGHQGELTSKVLDSAADGAAADMVIDIWSEGRRPLVARTGQLLIELQAAAAPDFAMLAVANRQLKSMVGG